MEDRVMQMASSVPRDNIELKQADYMYKKALDLRLRRGNAKIKVGD